MLSSVEWGRMRIAVEYSTMGTIEHGIEWVAYSRIAVQWVNSFKHSTIKITCYNYGTKVKCVNDSNLFKKRFECHPQSTLRQHMLKFLKVIG